jgi:hypothetical protein
MKSSFEKAFESLSDCVTNLGKGVEDLVNEIITEVKPDNSTIVIKKGSKVFLGKGVYVELLKDAEAKVIDEPAAASSSKE